MDCCSLCLFTGALPTVKAFQMCRVFNDSSFVKLYRGWFFWPSASEGQYSVFGFGGHWFISLLPFFACSTPSFLEPSIDRILVLVVQISLTSVDHMLGAGTMTFIREPHKHLPEFVKVNLAITVDVNFADNALEHVPILVHVVAKDRSDLFGLNGATTILVEQVEGSPHVRLAKQLLLLDGGRAPLIKVDLPTTVDIGHLKDLESACIYYFLIVVRVEATVATHELIARDDAVTILIELEESGPELVELRLGGQMSRHEGQRC